MVGIRGVIASASLKRSVGNAVFASLSGIRGVIASASLKPRQSLVLARIDERYPRRYRLGLIEANRASSGGAHGAPRYPRRYRLGLIEARSRSARRNGLPPGIRGVIASASLKRSSGVDAGASGGMVSEALSPRPH